MDQFGDELKKMLKAGIGAVATGLEMGQEAIEQLAQKGEPIYEQAKTVVADAAGKVKQAVCDGIDAMNMKPQVEELIDSLRGMGADAWKQVREAIDEFEAQAAEAEQAAKEAAQDILHTEENEKTEAQEEVPGDMSPENGPQDDVPQEPQE